MTIEETALLRFIPLLPLLGTALVIALYVLANVAYLVVLPFEEIQKAPEERVGTGGSGSGCQCYRGDGGVGQPHRRVGSGHESSEVGHTAADAISRPK